MKRLLFTALICGLGITGAYSQTSYGLKAGVNLSKLSNPMIEDLKEFEKSNVSFYVTGYADIPVAPQFSIQPGVSLQGKGAKYEGDREGVNGKITANVMYVEIPVNAVYYVPAGSGNVFLGAGPYVGYALSGKVKTVVDGQTESDDKIDFSGDDKEMNALDYGVNFLAGYKLNNGFLINAGYGLGLANLSAVEEDGETKYSNRVISIGVGFQF